MEAVAVKVIDLDVEVQELFHNEVRALRHLPEHRNLPKMYSSEQKGGKGRIVMSYFPFPTLSSFLAKHGALSTEDALFVLHQLVRLSLLITFVNKCPI